MKPIQQSNEACGPQSFTLGHIRPRRLVVLGYHSRERASKVLVQIPNNSALHRTSHYEFLTLM